MCAAENLPPAQLKKILNKQKKARRKAELEKAQAVEAQQKRDHKAKQTPANNEENEFQAQDELVPEKLERVRGQMIEISGEICGFLCSFHLIESKPVLCNVTTEIWATMFRILNVEIHY